MVDASIDLYSAATPNGWKVTILLEELGLAYKFVPVRLGEGEAAYGILPPAVRRLYRVPDACPMETGRHIADEYSIVDMACFPWIMTQARFEAGALPRTKEMVAKLRSRPAVQRGLAAGGGIRAMRDNAMSDQAKTRLFRWGEQDYEA